MLYLPVCVCVELVNNGANNCNDNLQLRVREKGKVLPPRPSTGVMLLGAMMARRDDHRCEENQLSATEAMIRTLHAHMSVISLAIAIAVGADLPLIGLLSAY